jgi:hypothetical protein
MDLQKIWIPDPKTKEASVSLTMLVVSFAIALVACGLQMAKVVENISSVTELFYATTALYFGRRFSAGSKTFSSESTDQTKPQ